MKSKNRKIWRYGPCLFSALIVTFAIFVPSPCAWPLGLTFDSSQSSSTKSNTLSANGQLGDQPAESITYNWNGLITKSTTTSTDSSGNTALDTTTELGAGVGLETSNLIYSNLDYSYSSIPEENLKVAGPAMSLGYTYKWAGERPANLGADVSYGFSSYDQTFETTVTRRRGSVTRPVVGSNQIKQTVTSFTIRGRPFPWISAKVSWSKYSYSKDINSFLQFLDNQTFLNSSSSGLSNTINGFYEDSVKIAFSFYFLTRFELYVSSANSKVASDGSSVALKKFMLYYDLLESWKVGLGAESSLSSVPGSDANRYADLSLGYNF